MLITSGSYIVEKNNHPYIYTKRAFTFKSVSCFYLLPYQILKLSYKEHIGVLSSSSLFVLIGCWDIHNTY